MADPVERRTAEQIAARAITATWSAKSPMVQGSAVVAALEAADLLATEDAYGQLAAQCNAAKADAKRWEAVAEKAWEHARQTTAMTYSSRENLLREREALRAAAAKVRAKSADGNTWIGWDASAVADLLALLAPVEGEET